MSLIDCQEERCEYREIFATISYTVFYINIHVHTLADINTCILHCSMVINCIIYTFPRLKCYYELNHYEEVLAPRWKLKNKKLTNKIVTPFAAGTFLWQIQWANMWQIRFGLGFAKQWWYVESRAVKKNILYIWARRTHCTWVVVEVNNLLPYYLRVHPIFTTYSTFFLTSYESFHIAFISFLVTWSDFRSSDFIFCEASFYIGQPLLNQLIFLILCLILISSYRGEINEKCHET